MSQVKARRMQPCSDCPFLRTSTRGWLGDDQPAEFYVKTESGDGNMPCHMDIDYTDPAWRVTQLPESAYCAGGMQHLNNSMKSPRDPERRAIVESYGTNPRVFDWPHEFLAHHLWRDEEISWQEVSRLLTLAKNGMVQRGEITTRRNEPTERR